MNKREFAKLERQSRETKASIRAYNKRILSKPGLKMFKFRV